MFTLSLLLLASTEPNPVLQKMSIQDAGQGAPKELSAGLKVNPSASAGLSDILRQERVQVTSNFSGPNVDLRVFEKNGVRGGVWGNDHAGGVSLRSTGQGCLAQ